MSTSVGQPLHLRAVIRVESEDHEVRRCARSVHACVERAGGVLTSLELVDETGERPIDPVSLGVVRGVHPPAHRPAPGGSEGPDDLLLVLSSATLLTDTFLATAADVLDADPQSWVFPQFVADLVHGMGQDVWEIPDSRARPETLRAVIDGVRHPRCLLLVDDGRTAEEWSQKVGRGRWTATVLDHLAHGGQLRVAIGSLLLCRSSTDLGALDAPDRAEVVAMAQHPFFARENWSQKSDAPSTTAASTEPDRLGRLVRAVRRLPVSRLIELPRARAMRAAVRGATRDWAAAMQGPPPALGAITGLSSSVTRLNLIDQQVHPMKLRGMFPHALPGSWTAAHFAGYLDQFGRRHFSDVFIRPAFEVGGVEVVVLDIARVLARRGARSLVVATDVSSSPLEARIRREENVDLWTVGAHAGKRLDQDVAHLLSMVLARQPPATVTVCDSECGFAGWLGARSVLTSSGTHLHYQDYSLPRLDGVPYEHVPSAPSAVAAASLVITDSDAHCRQIQTTYGTPLSKFVVLPHPVPHPRTEKSSGLSGRVLWAGRLSYEKCPETAIKAVGALADRGIEMDMYGPIDQEHAADIGLDRLLARYSNVGYRGTYSSLDELDFDRYDLMIIPSIQEGLPHAAIEGIFANLYLVVANVGGLPEAVESRMTGIVVEEALPRAYADAMIEFYGDAERHDARTRRQANERLRTWHTSEAFERAVVGAFRPSGE